MSLNGSLAAKVLSLTNEPSMVRPPLIDLNPFELDCYPFVIIVDKCNVSCNIVDDLRTKIYVPCKTKDVNVKVCNMIARVYEAETLVKHVSCDYK